MIHTCFTYPILNMGDFSALYGPLGCIDSTQKVKGNSLHAEEGIGKGKGSGIIHICFKVLKNLFRSLSSLRGLMVTSLDFHSGDPGSIPRWG